MEKRSVLTRMILVAVPLFLAAVCLTAAEPIRLPKVSGITIDGQGIDWKLQGIRGRLISQYNGDIADPKDLSTAYWIGWDQEGILLYLEVSDDSLMESENDSALWTGDSIELFIADKRGGSNMVQFVIALGNTDAQPNPRIKSYDHRSIAGGHGSALSLDFAVKRSSTVCGLEMRIPFSLIGKQAGEGETYALQFYINDSDDKVTTQKKYPWHYAINTHSESFAMYEVCLAPPSRSANSVALEVRAKVVDDTNMIIDCYSEKSKAGKPISILKGSKLLSTAILGGNAHGFSSTRLSVSLDAASINGDLSLQYDGKPYITLVPAIMEHSYGDKRPYPYSANIRRFLYNDRKTPPPSHPVVFIGSSSFTKWKSMEKDLAEFRVINRGFGGSIMKYAIHWADRIVIPYAPRAVVVYEGDNDMAGNIAPEKFLEDCKKFVGKVEDALPRIPIFFLAIKPSISRKNIWPSMQKANKLLQSYTKTKDNLHYIDVATPMLEPSGEIKSDIWLKDNLHMNRKGYELWIPRITKALMNAGVKRLD